MFLLIFQQVLVNHYYIKRYHWCLIIPDKKLVIPLYSLMEDQVSRLNKLGLKADSISALEEDEKRTRVESSGYSVVYGSPEAWLKNERWRSMYTNSKNDVP